MPEFGGFWNWLGWFLIVTVAAAVIGEIAAAARRGDK